MHPGRSQIPADLEKKLRKISEKEKDGVTSEESSSESGTSDSEWKADEDEDDDSIVSSRSKKRKHVPSNSVESTAGKFESTSNKVGS